MTNTDPNSGTQAAPEEEEVVDPNQGTILDPNAVDPETVADESITTDTMDEAIDEAETGQTGPQASD